MHMCDACIICLASPWRHTCTHSCVSLWDSIVHVTHLCVWHDSFVWVTWLIRVCDITHSCVWNDSFVCVTWLIRMFDMTHLCVWHDSFVCETWIIPACDMTHSCVRHDSFVCVTWLICVCCMTHSWVWRICACNMTYSCVWLIHVCDMTHSCIWLITRETWIIRVYDWFECVTRLFVRGGGLGSRPKKMYGERLGDGVEYHLMSPTPRR